MDYRIVRRYSDGGHIIFEVDHFKADGSPLGKQFYTFQGRVGHRTDGLSWESVLDVIDSIHPRMLSGEVRPDEAPPRMKPGKPYDFTGVTEQAGKSANLNRLTGLVWTRGDNPPASVTPSPRSPE